MGQEEEGKRDARDRKKRQLSGGAEGHHQKLGRWEKVSGWRDE